MAITRIRDILEVTDILLDVEESTLSNAVMKTALLLRGRPEISDWNAFSQQLNSVTGSGLCSLGNGVCIPHVRTTHATDLVIAVSRLAAPMEGVGGEGPVQHLFVMAVPVRLSSEYLRLVGAIARVFKNKAAVARLGLAPTPTSYLRVLEQEELRVD